MAGLKNKVKQRKPGVGPPSKAVVEAFQAEQAYIAQNAKQEAAPPPPMLIKRWPKARPGILKGTNFSK